MVIRWTKQAVDSLKIIYRFYLSTAGRDKALEIISAIRQETNYLLLFPKMGQVEYIQPEFSQAQGLQPDGVPKALPEHAPSVMEKTSAAIPAADALCLTGTPSSQPLTAPSVTPLTK